MIGVIDYGVGNMRSITNALSHLELEHKVCGVPDDLAGVDRILLPGVGHFKPAGERMAEVGMLGIIREHAIRSAPVLGICLGMQLLLEGSEEAPGVRGLELLPGRVIALEARRVPHMGWNRVEPVRPCPLIEDGSAEHFYFAHGYVVDAIRPDHLVATARIDHSDVPVMVGSDNVWGVQFHPEKSADAGLSLLRRFARC